MSVHALILAGGRGSRLGDVRKADLRIGNRRLLDRVADRLRDVAPSLLIATGPGQNAPQATGIGVTDADTTHQGPMAGILAGVRHVLDMAEPDDILLSVAVDTPFLPEDFARRLVAALDHGALAAYAAWGERIYPPNAAWRLSALRPFLTGEAPRSPKQALHRLGAVKVDWAGRILEDPFANLNDLADLLTLGRRARAMGE